MRLMSIVRIKKALSSVGRMTQSYALSFRAQFFHRASSFYCCGVNFIVRLKAFCAGGFLKMLDSQLGYRVVKYIISLVACSCAIILSTSCALALDYTPSQPDWSAAALPPAFRFESGQLLPLSTVLPNEGVSGNALVRDNRIDQLATNLDYDVDQIYNYVRRTILTTPTFGLSKGAFGALLDEAGNPFDQAHLMVELLRASDEATPSDGRNYLPEYVYGTVTLSGEEFESYFGVRSAQGACELLSAGGIPSLVNSNSNDCSQYSSTQSAIEIEFRHVWVSVQIDGVRYQFDPSLKPIAWRSPSTELMQIVRSVSAFQSPQYEVISNSVSSYSGYNVNQSDNIANNAVASLESMLTELNSELRNDYDVEFEAPLDWSEVVGGVEFNRNESPENIFINVRETSISTHNRLRTWSEIPDSLRAYFHFRAEGNLGNLDISIPAADVAGRRIWFAESNSILPFSSYTVTQEKVYLLVDEQVYTRENGEEASLVTDRSDNGGFVGLSMHINVALHSPYYNEQGLASDQAKSKYRFYVNNAFPTYIVMGLGERGDGAEVRNSRAVNYPGRVFWRLTDGCVPPPGQENCTRTETSSILYSAMTPAQANSLVGIGEEFLTQRSHLMEIYQGLSQRREVPHHILGVVSTKVELNPANWPQYDGDVMLLEKRMAGRSVRLNVATRSGAAAIDQNAYDLLSLGMSASIHLAALEHAILQKETDSPSLSTASSMFSWFASVDRVDAFSSEAGDEYGNRFVVVPGIYDTTAQNLAISQLWNGTYTPSMPFPSYQEFDAVVPQSLALGPSRKILRLGESVTDPDYIPEYNRNVTCIPYCTISDFDPQDAWRLRSPSIFAYQISQNSVAVAPLGLGGDKGGSSATFPEYILSPEITREALDENYESWFGETYVDGRTGGVTITPPADLSVGAGAWPYSLSFQRSYSSDNDRINALGVGWSHNIDAYLTIGTNIDVSLDGGIAKLSLPAYLLAASNLNLFELGGPVSANAVTALLLGDWWTRTVFDNEVTIQRGLASERFVRSPSGSWQSYPGSSAQLIQNGAVIAEANQTISHLTSASSPAQLSETVSEAFDRRGLNFTYISELGVEEDYTYGIDLTKTNYEPRIISERAAAANRVTSALGSGRTYLRRQSRYPYGVSVDYHYDVFSGSYGYQGERLSHVVNSAPFSRRLDFSYNISTAPDLPPNPYSTAPGTGVSIPYVERDPLQTRLTGVSGEGRSVTFNNTGLFLSSVIDVSGESTQYIMENAADRIQPNGRFFVGAYSWNGVDANVLTGIRLPHAPNSNFLTFEYDRYARITGVVDANGHRTTHLHAEGWSASTRDPLGAQYYSYFDRDGRMFAEVTPAMDVTYTQYDTYGRPISSQRGSINLSPQFSMRVESYYDRSGNIVLNSVLGGTDDLGQPLVHAPHNELFEYAYPSFPSLITAETDARGHTTRYCYSSVNPGCNNLGLPASNDGLLRAVLGPEGEQTLTDYDQYGRVTRIRTLERQ